MSELLFKGKINPGGRGGVGRRGVAQSQPAADDCGRHGVVVGVAVGVDPRRPIAFWQGATEVLAPAPRRVA